MASSSARPYQQHGVFFPVQRTNPSADPPITSTEWPALPLPSAAAQGSPRKKRRTAASAHRVHMAEKGFLLVKIIQETGVLLVQSETNGKLYIMKLSQPGSDFEDDEERTFYEDPLDLRVSTWAEAPGLLDDTAPFFNKLVYWQKLEREGERAVFALYFEYCNGGTVEELMEKYHKRGEPVPEHFVWLVAEQLSLAIAYLRYGIRPDTSDRTSPNDMDEEWEFLHHRDLAARNVFLSYPSTSPGRPPTSGSAPNAFPHIVLGDFGNAAIAKDDPDALPPNIVHWGPLEPELRAWEDVYTMGRILRSLCMTHVPFKDGNDNWSVRPDTLKVAAVNVHGGGAPRYSDELIGLLECFEWSGMTDGEIDDVADPAADIVANERWVVEKLLPAAQARVAAYRQPPAGLPPGYFNDLSIAWTKPGMTGVFSYDQRYAGEAGNEDAAGVQPRNATDEMEVAERTDRAKHAQLERMRERWGVVMDYEIRLVEFGVPVVAEEEIANVP